jgi:hypothetical protein
MFHSRTIPKYYQSHFELQEFYHRLKLYPCPHCKATGYLILHGFLYGYPESPSSELIVRGRRFFCSNKHRRKGCGRTFSILEAVFIARFNIQSKTLWMFLVNLLGGMNIHEAFTNSARFLSPSSAYRIRKRFILHQSSLRTSLFQNLPLSKTYSCQTKPEFHTIELLRSIFPLPSCPVTEFQTSFQASFL